MARTADPVEHDPEVRPASPVRLPMWVDAVLFDLDGTLLDSTAAVTRAWARWADEVGADPAGPSAMTGRPAREIVLALLGPERVDEALARYTAIAGETLEGVVALPGTAEALAATTGRRAVVTSSSGSIAAARLVACGLSLDGPLVSADDVERGKPDPEPFRRGAAAMGAPTERCLAVEDSPAGVDSARAAGCVVVALHHGGDGAALDAADVVVRDLAALRFTVSADRVRVEQRAG